MRVIPCRHQDTNDQHFESYQIARAQMAFGVLKRPFIVVISRAACLKCQALSRALCSSGVGKVERWNKRAIVSSSVWRELERGKLRDRSFNCISEARNTMLRIP